MPDLHITYSDPWMVVEHTAMEAVVVAGGVSPEAGARAQAEAEAEVPSKVQISWHV